MVLLGFPASAANFIGVTVNWYDNFDSIISQDYIFNETTPLPNDVWQNLHGVFIAPTGAAYAVAG